MKKLILALMLLLGTISVGHATDIYPCTPPSSGSGKVPCGDLTVNNTGEFTVGGTAGIPFATSATTNALNASNISSGMLSVARGGTGLSASPSNGTLLIGNGTGFSLAGLTAGTNISITPGAGTITIAATGGGSGCSTSGSNGNILTDNGSGGCASDANANLSAGALSLGASGTAGSVKLGNATSGTITLQPVTGTLGTVTLSFPAATDQLIARATTDTLTNKSISGGTNTLSNIANASLTNSAITINGTSTSLGGTRTLSLASSDFANQGTTTTVLHGNAAGNPSFGAVSLAADVSGQLPIGNVGSAGLSGTGPMAISSGGAISCATCVVASSPGAGLAHFAGSTQTVTSSAVNLAADVSGQLPITAVGSAGLSGVSPVTISGAGAIGCATCSTATVNSGTSGNAAYYSASSATVSSSSGLLLSSTAITGGIITVSSQSGATYTLASTDCFTKVLFTNSSAVTVTIPATLAIGCQIAVEQNNTGQITMTGTAVAAATLHNAHSYTKTFGQYSVLGITIDTNAGGSSAVAIMTGDGA